MNSMAYLELYRKSSADIEAERDATLERLGPSAPEVRRAVSELLRSRRFKYPLAVLPMIVHAVETGDPAPAVPLAVVHDLWWTSACYLDDAADGQAAVGAGDLGESEALLATAISGNSLPLLVVRSQRIPRSARDALTAELVNCWIAATEGQLADLGADTGTATRSAVVAAYRGKSGAPFSMVTAMGAELAGAEKHRVETWREFGNVFGVLWQVFNDQDDIVTGRHEDFRNGTVTYLLACALEDVAPRTRQHILDLHATAARSRRARAELTEVLLSPAVLGRYEEDISGFRGEAYRLLDELGGDAAHLSMLHELVDLASQVLLRTVTTSEGAASS
ncbi:polyprenyl synthetase family protein [Streptomyces sp. NPDC002851]